MAPTEGQPVHRVLVVDDDKAVLGMMTASLKFKGFEVVAAGGVAEALKCIGAEKFDALITDLHMPNAGDGFTVISAMRHSQPAALTMLLSGYPDTKSAMEAITLQADEILVKPVEIKRLAEMVRERLLAQKPANQTRKEKVSEILHRCSDTVVKDWLARAKEARELNHLQLADHERTGHLPKLIEDLVSRLNRPITRPPQDSDALSSPGLRSRDAGARIPNPSGDPVRDVERQYECSGFQLAVGRCDDDCRRGGRAVDSEHGQLHETCEIKDPSGGALS
jgi:DNA-binding response OmpR family regulator